MKFFIAVSRYDDNKHQIAGCLMKIFKFSMVIISFIIGYNFTRCDKTLEATACTETVQNVITINLY